MGSQEEYPRVGIGILILKDQKVLLGRRKGSHGAGQFAFPGGHLEHLEPFEDRARRETREEGGLEIENVRFRFLANLRQYHPKHHMHIGLISDWKSGEPKVMKLQKCESWNWRNIESVPKELFAATRRGFFALQTGKPYFDAVEAQRAIDSREHTLRLQIA